MKDSNKSNPKSSEPDKEIIKRLAELIETLGLTKAEFSRVLGYKSAHPIYMILNGSNRISTPFLKRLELTTLRVNTEWLLTGKGEMRTNEYLNLEYGQEVFHKGRVIYPRRLSKHQALILALKLADLIYNSPEEHYLTIEVQSFINFGLSFIFTEYSEEKDPKFDEVTYIGKKHYVGLNPEWNVIGYYDSWRNSKETARCENLLSQKSKSQFDSVIRNFLLSIYENFEFPEKDLFGSNETSREGYVTLYENLPNRSEQN
ncbi:MAG: helix-turn-helix transcriptional regulator [Reichenbachiella sp.]|uniref:helix-turn-helix domain-containing protein n=1 Tax=Reichenbachiella sp. TaxID=2184521 RepID=UPI003297D04A